MENAPSFHNAGEVLTCVAISLLTEDFTAAEKHAASTYLKRMHDNAVKVLKKEMGEADEPASS